MRERSFKLLLFLTLICLRTRSPRITRRGRFQTVPFTIKLASFDRVHSRSVPHLQDVCHFLAYRWKHKDVGLVANTGCANNNPLVIVRCRNLYAFWQLPTL